MNYLSSLTALAVALSLAACGGGGGSGGLDNNGSTGGNTGGNTGGSQPPTKLNDAAQVIEYHGDSTVWGYMSNTDGDRVETPAPAAFAASLPSYHVVQNMGLNRTTACDLLNGTGGYAQNWADYMAASDATVVIINHAINDMSRYDTSQYGSCLSQLVDIAEQNDKIVIFETPNPATDGSDGERLGSYVAEMKAVAQQKGLSVIDQYEHLRQPEWGGTHPFTICPDGVHPSQEIYLEKGRFAAERFVTFNSP